MHVYKILNSIEKQFFFCAIKLETKQNKMVTNHSIIILGTQMTHKLLPGLFQFLSLIFNQMRQPSKCIV